MLHYLMDVQIILLSIIIIVVAKAMRIFTKISNYWLFILIPIYGYIFPKIISYLELKREWADHPQGDSFNFMYAIFIWPACWAIGCVVAPFLFDKKDK